MIHITLPDDFDFPLLREEAKDLLELLETMSEANPSDEAMSYASALAFNIALAVGVKVGKSKDSQRKASKKASENRTADGEERWAKWQQDAEAQWLRTPLFSRPQVAKILAQKYLNEDDEDINPDTIRKKIRKPKDLPKISPRHI